MVKHPDQNLILLLRPPLQGLSDDAPGSARSITRPTYILEQVIGVKAMDSGVLYSQGRNHDNRGPEFPRARLGTAWQPTAGKKEPPNLDGQRFVGA